MTKEMHKIPKDGGEEDEFYVLTVEWHEENVTLTVVDNDVAWTGETDPAKIMEFCNALHKTKEEFLEELKHALSGTRKEFTFLMQEDNFIVKKKDLKSNIKVKFCSILLKRIPSIPIFMTVLSELLDQDKINRSNISKLNQEVQDLKIDLQNCMKKLQHFASEKASLETILYSKFCEILNAKKMKITYLESAIGASDNSSLLAGPSHNIKTNEQTPERSGGPVKHTNEDYPLPKRKCIKERTSENMDLEIKKSSDTTTHQIEPELDNENSNHYDSETDIETDDDSVVSSSANIIKPASFCDTIERSSQRILPKRTSANNILPKRNPNGRGNNFKNQEKDNAIPPTSLPKVDEFNSQSLLDDY